MAKNEIMRKADYRYNFDRDLYVNRTLKKAFSVEFVDDTPEEEIIRRIEEDTDPHGWTFYFNVKPSESVKHELERLLG